MGGKRVARQVLCPPVISDQPDDGQIGQQPQIAGFVFVHAVCAKALPGGRRASDPSCLLVQMEQTALANKPDVPIVGRDNLSDTPDKRSIAVIAVVSKCSGPWIELVEAAIFSTKPQIAPTVFGDALDRSTTERVRVVGVVKVSGPAFGCQVESVHPGVGGDPQIAVGVLHQILKEVGVQATGVVGSCLYTTKVYPSYLFKPSRVANHMKPRQSWRMSTT